MPAHTVSPCFCASSSTLPSSSTPHVRTEFPPQLFSKARDPSPPAPLMKYFSPLRSSSARPSFIATLTTDGDVSAASPGLPHRALAWARMKARVDIAQMAARSVMTVLYNIYTSPYLPEAIERLAD